MSAWPDTFKACMLRACGQPQRRLDRVRDEERMLPGGFSDYPKEGGASGATCPALTTQVRNADPYYRHKEETHEDGEAHVPARRHDAGVRGRFGGCSNAGAGGAAAASALRPPDHPRAGDRKSVV